jgi:hypothetical protein
MPKLSFEPKWDLNGRIINTKAKLTALEGMNMNDQEGYYAEKYNEWYMLFANQLTIMENLKQSSGRRHWYNKVKVFLLRR